jgi:Xaa-Pro aminopeptidase
MDHLDRVRRLRERLSRHRLDSLLVTHPPNIRYLCGFTGSTGALVVGRGGAALFTDGRYTLQARDEVRAARVVIGRKAPLLVAAEWLDQHGGHRRVKPPQVLGIEGEVLTVAARKRLVDALAAGSRVRTAPPLVEQARMVKDRQEIQRLREAVMLGASLFPIALQAIRPGVTEIEVAAALEYAARKAGASGMSFPTIIASGARSALAHGPASEQPIPSEGFVVCDFGVILAGYCSDMTRTVYLGAVTADALVTYEAVSEAQQAAIEAVRPGVSVGEVDRAARKSLKKRKLAKFFTHSTGHGVGLEIHEAPRVAIGQHEVLRPGMIITIEPGLYIPGKWGVRIEDMVLVTEHGCEVLTPTSKQFTAI